MRVKEFVVGGSVAGVLLGVLAPSASAVTDTTPPTLTSYIGVPTSVDVTTGPADATLVLRIADADSGFDHGTLTLSNGTHSLTPVDFDQFSQVSGTSNDGTYDVDVTFPQVVEGGSYTASIDLVDGLGNATTVPGSAGITVNRTPDSAAPALQGTVSTSASAVDTTQADRTVLYTAHVTDAVSGTAQAVLTIQPPDQDGFTPDPEQIPLNPATGTPNDGTWTASRTFFVGSASGDYTPIALDLTDGYGNTTTLTSGLGGVVTDTTTPDTTPPVLDTVTPAAGTVDATDADRTTTVVVAAEDDISGVASGFLQFDSPDGTESLFASFDGTPTTGTATNGTWTAEVDVPARSQTGDWRLSQVFLTDAQGNSLFLPDGVTPLPDAVISVNSTPDADGPSLGSFVLGPSPVTTAYGGGADISGRLTFTDAVSGFDHGSVTFDSPAGPVDDSATVFLSSFDLQSGDAHAGSITFDVFLPDAPESLGDWTVDTLTLVDRAGATTTFTGSQLAADGKSSGFTVTDDATDSQAPTVTAMSLMPSSVDTTTGDKPVDLTMSVHDTGTSPSGFSFAEVTLTSPSHNDERFFFLDSSNLSGGDTVTGTFDATATLDQFGESGTWTVSEVDLFDRADNEKRYLGGDLAAAGLTTTVDVTANTDTVAPTLTALTPASSDVTAGDGVLLHTTSTDDKSGVSEIEVTLSGPGGNSVSGFGAPAAPGSPASADVQLFFPRFNSTGAWTTSDVTVTDVVGNVHDYTGADLTALGLSRTINVTGTPDSVAPAAASLAFTPSPVDSSAGPVDVDVLAHLTDAGSGVEDASVAVTSPNGIQRFTANLFRAAGSSNDGWWQGKVSVPKYVDGGTWVVGPLRATDNTGNTLTMSSQQLTDAGLPGTLTVTGAVDGVPPALTTLTVTPSSIDTAAGGTVTLTGGATDAESGVGSVTFTVTAPDSTSRAVDANRISGSAASGSWRGSLVVPQWAPTGTWTISSVEVRDVYGNLTSYTVSDLSTAGLPSSFVVNGTPDTVAPSLTGLSLDSSSIDVSAGARSVTGTVTVTDDRSGVSGGFLTFVSPNGRQEVDTGFDAAQRTSGTATNATIPIVLDIPAFAQAGQWTLEDVTLFDLADNVQSYPPTPLPGGITTVLTVVDSNADTTPPAVTGVTFAPAPLDVTAAPGVLTVDVSITDDRSGFSGADLLLTSPSSQDVRQVTLGGGNRVSGTPTDGVYRASIPFSTATETGPWSVSLSDLRDVAGNSHDVATADIPGPHQVQIDGTAQVPAAPTDVFASAGNQRVALDWTRPANGGSPITGYVIVPTKNGVAQPAVDVGTPTSTTLTGLTNGASYTFTIAAVNAVGQGPASAPSSVVVPMPTVPGAPTITSATPGDGSVTLAWTAPTDNGGQPVTGYTVTAFRASDDALVKSQGTTALGATVTGLVNGTGYYFTLAATNSVGTGDADVSDVVTPVASPPTAPGAPTSVTAALAGVTSATVSWAAPASDGNAAITHYVVTPSIGGTPQPGLAVTTGNVLTTTVPGLSKGTSYTFTVHAVNSVGAGPESAASAVLAIPATVPGAPATAPTATAGDGQATVSWTAPADNGGSNLTGYDVLVSPHRSGQADPDVVHFADTSTSHPVTGLTNGTAYTFQVRALNGVGAGTYSPASTAVTPEAPAVSSVTDLQVVPSVDAAGHLVITASWSLPANDAGAHVCYLVNVTGAADPACSGALQTADIASGSPQTRVFTGSLILAGAPYAVTVFGYDAAGTRNYATGVSAGLAGTTVTIGRTATINYGKTVTISGTLKDTQANAVLAGKSVDLYKRASSAKPWTKVTTVTTSSTGVARSTQKPTTTTQYQFRFRGVPASGGGSGYGAAVSGVQSVRVAQVVSVTATATKLRHGNLVKFYGTVAPSAAGQYVYLQQKVGTKWKQLTIKAKIVKQRMPNGKTLVGYVLSYKPAKAGTYTFRVHRPATTKNYDGYSRALSVKAT